MCIASETVTVTPAKILGRGQRAFPMNLLSEFWIPGQARNDEQEPGYVSRSNRLMRSFSRFRSYALALLMTLCPGIGRTGLGIQGLVLFPRVVGISHRILGSRFN